MRLTRRKPTVCYRATPLLQNPFSQCLRFTLCTQWGSPQWDWPEESPQCVTGQPHFYRTLSSLTFLFSKNCCVKSSISIFSAKEKSSKVNTIQLVIKNEQNSCKVNGYFHQSVFQTKAQMYLKNTFPLPLTSKYLSLSLSCLTHPHTCMCMHAHADTHTSNSFCYGILVKLDPRLTAKKYV